MIWKKEKKKNSIRFANSADIWKTDWLYKSYN